MRVLLTGGAGYVGSHVARWLAKAGHDVTLFDNLSTGHREMTREFKLIVGDVGDSSMTAPLLRAVDAVMHFAAHAYVGESVQNPRKYFQNNVQAGLNLLNAVLDSPVRLFIFSSTCAVYGIPETMPITEDTVRNPINPYGCSKLLFENALEAYSKACGLRHVSLRYFNAAGADESGDIGELHDPETHLIPLALQAAVGIRSELEIYGQDYETPDGTCVRDYIHVNDLAEGHRLGLEYLAAGGSSMASNLGSGRGHSVREVVSMAEHVTGRVVPVRYSPRRPGDPPVLVADPSRAEKLLGWKASRSLEHVVSTAWNWMQRSSAVARLSTRTP